MDSARWEGMWTPLDSGNSILAGKHLRSKTNGVTGRQGGPGGGHLQLRPTLGEAYSGVRKNAPLELIELLLGPAPLAESCIDEVCTNLMWEQKTSPDPDRFRSPAILSSVNRVWYFADLLNSTANPIIFLGVFQLKCCFLNLHSYTFKMFPTLISC